eukprot:scaffold2677_cov220-Pinguiococcus_pyrenoidosus.AAC.3
MALSLSLDGRRVLLKEYFVSSAGNLAEKELDARVAIYKWWADQMSKVDVNKEEPRPLPCTYLLGSLTADVGFLGEDFIRGWKKTFPMKVGRWFVCSLIVHTVWSAERKTGPPNVPTDR